jgi:hypothetical protein
VNLLRADVAWYTPEIRRRENKLSRDIPVSPSNTFSVCLCVCVSQRHSGRRQSDGFPCALSVLFLMLPLTPNGHSLEATTTSASIPLLLLLLFCTLVDCFPLSIVSLLFCCDCCSRRSRLRVEMKWENSTHAWLHTGGEIFVDA